MCRRDANARRQPLKNLRKHRQERQNSRFELFLEVRERCQKSKKIDARAYVKEGSLQGRLRWPKPFQNHSPKHLKFWIPRLFFAFWPKSAPRASQERTGALQERPRAPQEQKNMPRHAKTFKNPPKHKKMHENVQKLPKTIRKCTLKDFDALPRPGWVSNADPS